MKKNHNMILIDIGSTIIKIAVYEGKKIKRKFFERSEKVSIYDDVKSKIDKLKKKYPSSKIKICSSANGGLKVGLISLTSRYSGEVAKRIILNSGSNLIWEYYNLANNFPNKKVDVVVISGGLNIRKTKNQTSWITDLLSLNITELPVIFCGNKYLNKNFKKYKFDIIQVENVLGDNMKINSYPLTKKLRQLYLLDLIHTNSISKLQKYSQSPIIPTPAVCELSFNKLLKNKSKFNLISPIILIDMGGATTDVYYGRELIKDLNNLDVEALSINRFVFSSIGVVSSKKSSIMKLQNSKKLYDIIHCFSNKKVKERYIKIRENVNEWITKEYMFYLCFGLVLEKLLSGKESGHPLSLEKLNTIIITGGCSQVCKKKIFNKIFSLFVNLDQKNRFNIEVDKKYEIWNLGLVN